MTVPKVLIGFEGPAIATAFQLDSPTFGVLDQDKLGIGEILVDLTDRLASISISRGRSDDTEEAQSGTARVLLRNRDGRLDPLNTASDLFPGVEPRRTINIYADDVQVFGGFVDDIELDYTPGGDANVVVTATDGLARFALAELEDIVVPEEQSGERVGTLISEQPSLWSGSTDLDVGDSTFAAGTATGNALAYLRRIATSEAGFLFVSREGVLTFRNRNNPAENPDDLILSDAGVGACTAYEAISRLSGQEDLYNIIRAEYAGITYQRTDASSVEAYGPRSLDLGESLLASATDVVERLDHELAIRRVPTPTVSSVTVSQARGQCLKTLEHELGNSVRVIFTPPGVAQQTQDSILIGIGHSWTVGASWRTTFTLVARSSSPFLILDDVTYGELDFGVLAF